MTEDSLRKLRELREVNRLIASLSPGKLAVLQAALILLMPDPSASRAREIAELERMLGRD